MARQSLQDRQARFSQGSCPVHGIGLTPLGGWYVDGYGRKFVPVDCPRHDCGVSGRAYVNGGYLLDDEHAHLVGQVPLQPVLLNVVPLEFGPGALLEEHTVEQLWAYIRESDRLWQTVIDEAVREYLRRVPHT